MALKCNVCMDELRKEAFLSVNCSHLFCYDDAKEYFTKKQACPVCSTPVTNKKQLVKITLDYTNDKILALCGLSPKVVLDAASRSVEFYVHQMNQEIASLHSTCKEFDSLRAKAKALEDQLQNLDKRNADLEKQNAHLHRQLERNNEDLEQKEREMKDWELKYSETIRKNGALREMYEKLKRQLDQQPIHIECDKPGDSPRRTTPLNVLRSPNIKGMNPAPHRSIFPSPTGKVMSNNRMNRTGQFTPPYALPHKANRSSFNNYTALNSPVNNLQNSNNKNMRNEKFSVVQTRTSASPARTTITRPRELTNATSNSNGTSNNTVNSQVSNAGNNLFPFFNLQRPDTPVFNSLNVE